MIAIAKRPWNLSATQRLLITLVAGIYLIAFRPWAESNSSIATSVYAGAAAMLVLAALPPKLRMITALIVAVVVAFVVLFAGRAILGL